MEYGIRLELETMAEPKYRDFAAALIPNCHDMLGVRLPALRAMAKILCRGHWQAALAGEDRYFEERMLRGFVIAGAPVDIAQRAKMIWDFLPEIDNWSVCDSFCASLKDMKKEPARYWPLVRSAIESEAEFTVRFAVVSMLDHYLDTDYLPEVLALLPEIPHRGFYVRMAVAWALATAFVRDPDGVLDILRGGSLDADTRKMTIRKLLDSRRVVSPYREIIKEMQKADGKQKIPRYR